MINAPTHFCCSLSPSLSNESLSPFESQCSKVGPLPYVGPLLPVRRPFFPHLLGLLIRPSPFPSSFRRLSTNTLPWPRSKYLPPFIRTPPPTIVTNPFSWTLSIRLLPSPLMPPPTTMTNPSPSATSGVFYRDGKVPPSQIYHICLPPLSPTSRPRACTFTWGLALSRKICSLRCELLPYHLQRHVPLAEPPPLTKINL